MSSAAESAELILKLFELRREPVLRQARAWFGGEFNPTTFEELRMVPLYPAYGMAAVSLVLFLRACSRSAVVIYG